MKNIYVNLFKVVSFDVEVGYELRTTPRRCDEDGFQISIKLTPEAIRLFNLLEFSYEDNENLNCDLDKAINAIINITGTKEELLKLSNARKHNNKEKEIEILKDMKLNLVKNIDKNIFDINSLIVYNI